MTDLSGIPTDQLMQMLQTHPDVAGPVSPSDAIANLSADKFVSPSDAVSHGVRDIGNLGEGLFAGLAGLPGGVESALRWASRNAGGVSQTNVLPTTEDINAGKSVLSIGGAPADKEAAIMRSIGSFLSPVALARGPQAIAAGARAVGDITSVAPLANSVVRQAIEKLGSTSGTPSEDMLNSLQTAQQNAKAATSKAWSDAGIDENANVPKNWLQGRVDNYVNGLKVAEQNMIPSNITDTLAAIPDRRTTLGEIQAWRSQLGDEIRSAYRSGLNNKARILGGLENTVGDFLDELPQLSSQGPTAADFENYNAARSATRQMKQTFAAPGSPVTTALSPREFGTAAPSNTADLFIKPNTQAGAPEAFNAYMQAIGSDPAGRQAARDAFAQKFLDAVQTTGTDETGQANISPAKLSKFLDQYDHVTGSGIFNADQKNVLGTLSNYASASNRVTGRRFVDVLAQRVATPVVGAIAGYHFGGGITGAVAGAAAGEGVNRVLSAIASAPRSAAVRMLADAVSNPATAKALLRPSSARLAAPIQTRLLGLLSGGSLAASGVPAAPSPAVASNQGASP